MIELILRIWWEPLAKALGPYGGLLICLHLTTLLLHPADLSITKSSSTAADRFMGGEEKKKIDNYFCSIPDRYMQVL